MNIVLVVVSSIVCLVLWVALRPIMKKPYRPEIEKKDKHKRFLLESWTSWLVPAAFPPIPLMLLAFTDSVKCQTMNDFSRLVTAQLACAGIITFLFLVQRRLSVPYAMASAAFMSFIIYIPAILLGVWDVLATVIVFGTATVGLTIKIWRDAEKKQSIIRNDRNSMMVGHFWTLE
ncbi:hypothetical protein GC173_04030 [bacterium]|nr:hypothetical protein [bacterium]